MLICAALHQISQCTQRCSFAVLFTRSITHLREHTENRRNRCCLTLYICTIVGRGCTDKRFDRKGEQIALNAAQVHGEMSIFARAVRGILIKKMKKKKHTLKSWLLKCQKVFSVGSQSWHVLTDDIKEHLLFFAEDVNVRSTDITAFSSFSCYLFFFLSDCKCWTRKLLVWVLFFHLMPENHSCLLVAVDIYFFLSIYVWV